MCKRERGNETEEEERKEKREGELQWHILCMGQLVHKGMQHILYMPV